MHSIQLKVKLKSLAAEARIIKEEERKAVKENRRELLEEIHQKISWRRYSLEQHRKMVVRPEARATNLAYGYLKGYTYSRMERNPASTPQWDRVAKMIRKYGPYMKEEEFKKAFSEWQKS